MNTIKKMNMKSAINRKFALGVCLVAAASWSSWSVAECEHDGAHNEHHNHHHEGNHKAHHHDMQHTEHNHTALPMSADVPEGSLHHLDATWVDHTGEQWALSDFSGQFLIVSMIYASCETACPVLVEDTKRIYNALDPAEKKSTSVILFSFDSENDTPENLKAYSEKVGLSAQPWHFATGEKSDIRTLAALLGVRYRSNPAGGYDHSNVVVVLNPEGEVIHRQEGLNRGAEGAVSAIRKAL